MHDSANKSRRQGNGSLRSIHSADLFGDRKVLLITHQDEEYRLQITAMGKLLLTK